MKNELDKIATIAPPSNIVNQNGEKNIHINHAENVTQNIIIPITYNPSINGGIPKPATKEVSSSYYNLFVVGGETFDNSTFILSPDRAISKYWTSEEVRHKYAELSAEAIEEIKTFPTLFMAEAEKYNGNAGDEQNAIFGFVDDIRIQDNGVKIRCQLIWPIPMKQLSEIGFNLGMKDMTRAISEMNHTHWAIKRINLFEELKDANISLMGINI